MLQVGGKSRLRVALLLHRLAWVAKFDLLLHLWRNKLGLLGLRKLGILHVADGTLSAALRLAKLDVVGVAAVFGPYSVLQAARYVGLTPKSVVKPTALQCLVPLLGTVPLK